MMKQIDLEGRISAAAKRAREKYEMCHGEGMTGHAVANWKESVKPYFDEFIKAVRNNAKPIPAEYFDVGMAFPENPIFAFPYSKAIHCILCDLDRMDKADLERLVKDVVEPYVCKWEELLSGLEMRFGMHDRIAEFRGKLSAVFDKIYSLSFGRQGHEFFDGYNATYTEFRNGFRALAEALMSSHEDATHILNRGGESKDTVGAARRHYERYCLPSEKLAKIFKVRRETITRWKTEDSNWGRRFRLQKDSLAGMERLAREYNAVVNLRSRRDVRFDQNIHGAVEDVPYDER